MVLGVLVVDLVDLVVALAAIMRTPPILLLVVYMEEELDVMIMDHPLQFIKSSLVVLVLSELFGDQKENSQILRQVITEHQHHHSKTVHGQKHQQLTCMVDSPMLSNINN
jgi:hypothetical protein